MSVNTQYKIYGIITLINISITLTNLHVFVNNSTTRWFCETSILVLSRYDPVQRLLNKCRVNEDVGSGLVEALSNKCTQPADKWVKGQVTGHDSCCVYVRACVWKWSEIIYMMDRHVSRTIQLYTGQWLDVMKYIYFVTLLK